MHELFTLEETLPVDPGQSPFAVRGVIYGRMVDHAIQIAGRLDEFVEGLPDARVKDFLKQQFKWTQFYDSLPMTPVQVHLSRLQGRDFEEATRARAAEGANRLIPRMFRLVIALGRPRSWALHAPRLMSEYCGFGEIRIVHADDQQAVFHIDAVPRFIAASHANTLIGIFEGSLALLQAKNIASRYFDVAPVGEQDGHPLLSYALELSWN
jgi:hypothetical protein